MSDSSDDSAEFLDLREDEESDDEQPRKRRKTVKTLRGRGIGFTKATEEDGEDDFDDERPALGAFRGAAELGEYEDEIQGSDPLSRQAPPRRSPPRVTRPSAFGSSGTSSKMSFAARQMAKMGYVEGKGLGARGEGIAAPIVAVGTQGRTGLGMGSAAEEPKKKRLEKSKLQTSTPGSRTPVSKARPKTKYQTVADIEAGGLKVPAALRSIIIDATGAEKKTVSSPAGFTTPTRDLTPEREVSKIAQRAKRDLEEYANAWNAARENESHLEGAEEEQQRNIELVQHDIDKLQAVIVALETTSLNGSEMNRDATRTAWESVVAKLQEVQSSYAEYIETLSLPEAAVAVMVGPFKQEMGEWSPLVTPNHLITSLHSLSPLLELEKDYGRKCAPFHSLLRQDWLPKIRVALREQWDVYNPLPAVALLRTWKPIIPSWMYCNIIDELIVPQLIAAIDSFKLGRKGKKNSSPPLLGWLYDWWELLSHDGFYGPTLSTLATHIKPKLDSESWPAWKQLLGERRREHMPVAQSAPAPLQNPSPSDDMEISFVDQVETWATEEDLLLESLHRADAWGHRLYKLRPVNSAGAVIYMDGDVVYDSAGNPYGLDTDLANLARHRAPKQD